MRVRAYIEPIRLPYRTIQAILIIGLTGFLVSCGASQATKTTSQPSPPTRDRDDDFDHNDDDGKYLAFGHAADQADARAITKLIRQYYAAAVNGNGVTGCSLLYPFVAEAIIEDYGHSLSATARTCASVLTALFARDHRELLAQNDTLKMYSIRTEGDRSLAIVDFSSLSEVRVLRLRRTHTSWRLLSVLDELVE